MTSMDCSTPIAVLIAVAVAYVLITAFVWLLLWRDLRR